MDKKEIEITLSDAKVLYNSGNQTLKELALRVYSKEELEIPVLPKSWKEFCRNYKGYHYFINFSSNVYKSDKVDELNEYSDKNSCKTEDEAEAFVAMMQLRMLWNAYVGSWRPDWRNDEIKFIICQKCNIITVDDRTRTSATFSFPTEELAKEFSKNFEDLLEKAKILL